MAIKNTYQMLSKLDDDDDDKLQAVSVCIFKVPESMRRSKPEAYAPQLVGLGPYNHFRPELQQMQTFKLALVNRSRTVGIEFLRRIGVPSCARSSYASYLDIDDDSLSGLLAVDSLYLFELLRQCVVGGNDADRPEFFFRDFVNPARRGVRNITVQDAIKLENQIPIHVVRLILTAENCEKILAGERRSLSTVTEFLPAALVGFAAALAPLKVIKNYPLYKVVRHAHLLDLLYTLVVSPEVSPDKDPGEEEEKEVRFVKEVAKKISAASVHSNQVLKFGGELAKDEEIFLEGIVEVVVDVIAPELGEPIELVQGLIELPWSKIWLCVKNILTGKVAGDDTSVIIPRATELRRKGITFLAVDRIADIKFDKNALAFHLPAIKLNANSEAVLRNLVAYEAMVWTGRGSLVLACYMAMMGCLAKGAEDVRFLAEEGIVEAAAGLDDATVARQLGGMREAIGRAAAAGKETAGLDEAIGDVKRYYEGLWSVCVCKYLKKWGRVCLNCFGLLLFLLVCLGGLGLAVWLVYKWLIKAIKS